MLIFSPHFSLLLYQLRKQITIGNVKLISDLEGSKLEPKTIVSKCVSRSGTESPCPVERLINQIAKSFSLAGPDFGL